MYRGYYRRKSYGGKSAYSRRFKSRPTPGFWRSRSRMVIGSVLKRRTGYAANKRILSVIGRMAEKKYFDVSSAANNVTFNGTIASLSDVTQGTTDITRVGDKLTMNSVELKFFAVPGTATLYSVVRLVVFLWRDDTTPTVNDLMQAGAGTSMLPLSPLDHDDRAKRKILYDKYFTMTYDNYGANQYGANAIKVFKTFMDLKKWNLRDRTVSYFAGGTAGFNKIWIFYGSTNGTGANQPVSLSYYSRINFTDT
jgi:hypothetical protein